MYFLILQVSVHKYHTVTTKGKEKNLSPRTFQEFMAWFLKYLATCKKTAVYCLYSVKLFIQRSLFCVFAQMIWSYNVGLLRIIDGNVVLRQQNSSDIWWECKPIKTLTTHWSQLSLVCQNWHSAASGCSFKGCKPRRFHDLQSRGQPEVTPSEVPREDRRMTPVTSVGDSMLKSEDFVWRGLCV